MRVRLSGLAESDLAAVREHIAEDNPAAASRVIARILQSLEYLGDFPRIGRIGTLPDTRELAILGLPYRAVYRIEGDIVLILAVLHSSRRYPPVD